VSAASGVDEHELRCSPVGRLDALTCIGQLRESAVAFGSEK
jgi:hypothetical protein